MVHSKIVNFSISNQVLSHHNILAEIDSAASKLEPLLPISAEQRQLLLLKFNWDIKSLKNSFQEYADMNSFLCENGISSEDIFIDEAECAICCAPGRLLGLECRHLACENCWNKYIRTKINAGQCLLGCMNFGCNMLFSNEMLGKFHCSSKLKISHRRLIKDSYINNKPNLAWCNKKCGVVVRRSNCNTVTCSCGSTFCFLCRSDAHHPATCRQIRDWGKQHLNTNYSDGMTVSWISLNTRECPRCFIPILKNGGCNHMTCTGCRYDYCWVCFGNWWTHYGGCKQKDIQVAQSRLNSRATSNISAQRLILYENHKKCLEREQQVLSSQNIFDQISSAVSKLEPILPITPEQRQLLLLKFNWDIESLKNSIQEYTDMNSFLLENGVCPDNTVSVLKKSECEVCCSELTVLGLRCRHMACLNCWSKYLAAKISDGQCILGCIWFECSMCITNDILERFLCSTDSQIAHQKLIKDSYINSDSSLAWCNRKCGMAVRRSYNDTVFCSCGSTFCFLCRSDAHYPATCRQLQLWGKKHMGSDQKTSSWIVLNTRECPRCFIPIQKSGGCDHLTCTECRYEYCWVCLQDWKTHFDGCQQFYISAAQSQFNSRANSYIFAQHLLRFEHHQQCLNQEQKVRYLYGYQKTVVECRRTLMNSYVFGYYLKEGLYTSFLEKYQLKLEIAVEELARYYNGHYQNNIDCDKTGLRAHCMLLQKALLAHCSKGAKYENLEGRDPVEIDLYDIFYGFCVIVALVLGFFQLIDVLNR
ncbi:hypothetical protein CAEBREN_17795 [Caenorhabditis brenneri]|uniref:RBR-type E3 ubiquitin transferase n=1 Tax=Caenorhabditis brenneri TaxID=135651 RepID=G0MMG7_CAEBE|nr:hypothetical protein CAEBREN_17795 [Caenorhabditis brenneri]